MITVGELKTILDGVNDDVEIVLDKDENGWFEIDETLALHYLGEAYDTGLVLSINKVE